jgi:hypothetical protein
LLHALPTLRHPFPDAITKNGWPRLSPFVHLLPTIRPAFFCRTSACSTPAHKYTDPTYPPPPGGSCNILSVPRFAACSNHPMLSPSPFRKPASLNPPLTLTDLGQFWSEFYLTPSKFLALCSGYSLFAFVLCLLTCYVDYCDRSFYKIFESLAFLRIFLIMFL